MARELFALLKTAGERPPFILVGHSMGGTNVQFFLEDHPDIVAGMVLIDASPDPPPLDQVTPQMRADFERNIAALEGLDMPTLLSGFTELTQSQRSLGNKPLVVLVAGRVPEEKQPPGINQALAQAALAERQASQQRLTALSTNNLLYVVAKAGHHVPHDAPEVVARAVASVVEASRTGTKLDAASLQ